MIFLLAFWLFLFGALTLSWQAGDRLDRQVIVAIAIAAALSALAHSVFVGRTALAIVLLLDAALLVVFVRYALVSRRHWPVWFAGFQVAIVAMTLGSVILAHDNILRFDLIGGFWAIVALTGMVIGLFADQRRGISNLQP